jgi:hypothetical protein
LVLIIAEGSRTEAQAKAMHPMPTLCPVCGDPLTVTRLHCRSCDSLLEGRFEIGRLGLLSAEQREFVETFMRCEGKLNRMERVMGLSYPTLRSRLTEVIQQMGFQAEPEAAAISDEERHAILDRLAAGELSSEEAMRILEGA